MLTDDEEILLKHNDLETIRAFRQKSHVTKFAPDVMPSRYRDRFPEVQNESSSKFALSYCGQQLFKFINK